MFGTIHRWLGLTSGLVVFIVAITGCLYAFQSEIKALFEDYKRVDRQDLPFLEPSVFKEIADSIFPNHEVHSVNYGGHTDAVELSFYEAEPKLFYYSVYCNPYTGEVVQINNNTQGFFYQVLQGHYNLWLPKWLGQPIVAISTLIFFLMVITGLILWWPRNKNARKQRFRFKWKSSTSKKRKNYDLHTILGFYSIGFALLFSWTGLVWGFSWFAYGSYKLIGGNKSLIYEEPISISDDRLDLIEPVDYLWENVTKQNPSASIDVHFPESDSSSIHFSVNHNEGTYYSIDYLYFDQNSLEEIEVNHLWGKYKNADASDRWLRMNYDVHIGSIGGIPGKVIAFLASLIIASMPVTGFYIWFWRKKKKRS